MGSVGGVHIAYATTSVQDKRKDTPGLYKDISWDEVPQAVQAAAADYGWEHFGKMNFLWDQSNIHYGYKEKIQSKQHLSLNHTSEPKL